MLNQKEIELIRKEMTSLKDCITKYVGYVFAGSGAAVYGIARMNRLQDSILNNDISFGMSFVSFVISVIISFITVIIFYKFHSHNRYAGYCKVLSHEKYTFPDGKEIKLTFSWEMAVGKLRCLDLDSEKMKELIKKTKINKISEKEKEKLGDRIVELIDSIDKKGKFFDGLKILAIALTGKVESRSWAFPPFVTSICFILSLGFVAAGHFLAFNKGFSFNFLLVIAIITSIFQIVLWWRLIKKLDDLMNGNLTVESFFLKLLPIRSSYLNSYDIIPEYLDTDNFVDAIICPKKI
ncbi:MAG: hypothetical protein PHE15_05330 [Dehalococcoidales bacterium]|nr:hypothetical protein [Dehalococcoidales bacterium]